MPGGLRAVGEELWTVDAPLRFMGVEIGRRMAVVRLAGGELLLHSPAPLIDELSRALDSTASRVIPSVGAALRFALDIVHATATAEKR